MMSAANPPRQDFDKAGQYEIRIHGHLDSRWAARFEDLNLSLEESGDTLISGRVIDQAALFGLLRKVRDAGMSLVSVNRVTDGRLGPDSDPS